MEKHSDGNCGIKSKCTDFWQRCSMDHRSNWMEVCKMHRIRSSASHWSSNLKIWRDCFATTIDKLHYFKWIKTFSIVKFEPVKHFNPWQGRSVESNLAYTLRYIWLCVYWRRECTFVMNLLFCKNQGLPLLLLKRIPSVPTCSESKCAGLNSQTGKYKKILCSAFRK